MSDTNTTHPAPKVSNAETAMVFGAGIALMAVGILTVWQLDKPKPGCDETRHAILSTARIVEHHGIGSHTGAKAETIEIVNEAWREGVLASMRGPVRSHMRCLFYHAE